jgi:hypothetical protein
MRNIVIEEAEQQKEAEEQEAEPDFFNRKIFKGTMNQLR